MNEKAIWDFLIKKTNNPYGTAAIMGNLMAESSLNPCKTTGAKAGAATYVDDTNAGKIDFVHDGVAFGLVQWCYFSRKQGLIDYARQKNISIGNLQMQLEYMWQELQLYKTVLDAVKNAKDIRTASDIFMLKYEKPAGKTESAKQKRAAYGQKYFDQFAKGVTNTVTTGKTMVVARVNVNIRSGDATTFIKLGSIKAGDRLEWVATAENGWFAVRYNGKIGWVSGDFAYLSKG